MSGRLLSAALAAATLAPPALAAEDSEAPPEPYFDTREPGRQLYNTGRVVGVTGAVLTAIGFTGLAAQDVEAVLDAFFGTQGPALAYEPANPWLVLYYAGGAGLALGPALSLSGTQVAVGEAEPSRHRTEAGALAATGWIVFGTGLGLTTYGYLYERPDYQLVGLPLGTLSYAPARGAWWRLKGVDDLALSVNPGGLGVSGTF